MNPAYPFDAAWLAHPDWRRCVARGPNLRDDRGRYTGFDGCGYPLDPALGDVDVHPWCARWYHPAVDPAETNRVAREYRTAVAFANFVRRWEAEHGDAPIPEHLL